MNLEDKINTVKDIIKDKKVAIGFSGGADSTFIAYLSSKVAKDTLAVTIDNHLMPTGFVEHAKRVADLFNIKHEVIDIDFYEDKEFLKNNSKRCYNCRNLMYGQIKKVAAERGFDYVCDGNNISDFISDRPGILITYEKEFETPLIEARLSSKEIHDYLDKNNIPYSKSTTCLATRIPTNTPTSREKIEMIRKCEDYIYSNTNCEIVKVRYFEEIGICEVDDINEITSDNKFKQINDELKHQGFKKVALNLSPIQDNDMITLDYAEGGFAYQLPYTINLEKTKSVLESVDEITESELKIDNITISRNGLIKGKNFKNYESALDKFMKTLSKIRRNI
ncbi:MAG: 7-cyano-7-deazaguanine synthase [Methanobrevibacter sp.]|uniref:7-cyano-7-deazaguanine synthase n=1 Tax=Methanobrevibacter sp. TaxID=66852 RepID=UPI002E7A4ACD|nr:7-cyano-7-deazaguanine synthase [Methanobrevibacter sp.]MEE0935927.1 7-cyano-7-deazaguanine synthase [Methanobrevibacter sp.]